MQPLDGSQVSVVQTFPSSQFGGVPAWQPAAPAQTSAPLHALPSSQRRLPPSSAVPLQSLSAPSHSSKPTLLWMLSSASALTCIAFVPQAEATLSNGLSAQVGFEIAERSTVRVPPTGRYMT